MNRKKEKNNKSNINKSKQINNMKEEIGSLKTEDVTKYGEFVSSYFSWLTLDGQKHRAEELENITKKKH